MLKTTLPVFLLAITACAQTRVNLNQITVPPGPGNYVLMAVPSGITKTVRWVRTDDATLIYDTATGILRATGTASSVPIGFVDQIPLSGVLDGVNAVFALPTAPNPASSLKITRNGLALKTGVDYTLAGSSVTFLLGAVPEAGAVLLASYRTGGQ